MNINESNGETLAISMPLTIRNADAVRELLLGQLQERHELVVELEDGADADLSCIQVIEAARVEARDRDVSFTLSKPVGEQIRTTLWRAGILTGSDSASRMFWLHRKEVQ